MIVEFLITGLLGLLTAVLQAIPDASLPASASNILDNFAATIGGALGGLDSLLPISELAIVVGWILGTYVPIAVAYQTALWVWSHLPVVGSGN